MPALSSRTQAQTRRERAEYFLRSSAEVDGCTFYCLAKECSNPAAGDEPHKMKKCYTSNKL